MNKTFILALVVLVVTPALAQAQTVTVEAQANVPPPPQQQPQPQGQVVVQPAPQQYGQQPQYGQQQPQPYYQPAPVQPRQERTRSRPIWGLVVSGAVMLGVSWIIHAALISPLAGYSADRGFQPEWGTFRGAGAVPVIGPWIQMAVKPGSLDQDSWGGYLAVDGLLQAAGLTMLILGLALQETETYYVMGDGTGPSLALMPTAGENGGGVAALGRF